MFVPIASPDKVSDILIAGNDVAISLVESFIIVKTSLFLKSKSRFVTKSATGIVLLFMTVVVFSFDITS